MIRRFICFQAPLFTYPATCFLSSLADPDRELSLASTTFRNCANFRQTASQFTAPEVSRRLSSFTYADWSYYFGVVATSRGNFLLPLHHGPDVRKIREGACDWLSGHLNHVKPIDYYNFLRFIQILARFTRRQHHFNVAILERMPSVPVFVHDDVLMWFNKNFDTLEPQAFFEILNQHIKYVVLQNLNAEAKLRLGDVLKVISHGIELVKNEDKMEIINILQLLYTIEYYGQIFLHDSVFASFAQRVIEVLEKRDMVVNRFDLFHSLTYLSSMEYSNRETPTSRAIFRRHANGNYAAWKWLQNSIELVFKDDELADMRQLTAVAAVRAYKWNAVDFSPDDVDRFLETAVEPFQTDPTDIFDPPKHALSQKAVNRLLHMITAIRSTCVSDLPRLEKLSVRLDDAFWNKFFQLVEKEAPKLGTRVSLLYSLNHLKKIMPPLAPDELPFVCEPINSERRKWLFNIQNKFIKR